VLLSRVTVVSGRKWILVARYGLTDVGPVANRCQFATVPATVGTGCSRVNVFPHTAATAGGCFKKFWGSLVGPRVA